MAGRKGGLHAAFGYFDSITAAVSIFLVYGLYFGLTEGIEKAWVADLVPTRSRGTAFGIYNAALGLGGLLSSVVFGLIWTCVSPSAAFFTGAAVSLGAIGLLYSLFSAVSEIPGDAANPRHQR